MANTSLSRSSFTVLFSFFLFTLLLVAPQTSSARICSALDRLWRNDCDVITVATGFTKVADPAPATAPAPTPALDPVLQNPYGGFYRFTPTSIPNTAEVQTSDSFVDTYSTGYGTDQLGFRSTGITSPAPVSATASGGDCAWYDVWCNLQQPVQARTGIAAPEPFDYYSTGYGTDQSGFRSTYDDYYSTGYGTDQSGFRSAGVTNPAPSAPSRVSSKPVSGPVQWNDPTDATSGWTEDESYRAPWNDPTDATSGWTEDESYRTSGPRIEQQAPDSRYNEQFGTPSNPCDFAPGYISDGRGGCMSNDSLNPTVQPYTSPTPAYVNGGIYDDGVLVGQRTGSGADLAPTYMTGWNWFDCTILRACNTAQTVAPVEDRSFSSNSGLQLDYGGGYDPGGANYYVPVEPTTYPVQDYRGLVENPLPPSPTVYYPDYGYEYGSNDIGFSWDSVTFSDWYY